jgi:hypothetical protein
MLENITLKNILVIDIETVPQYPAFKELPDAWKKLWSNKIKMRLKEGETAESYYHSAGIYSEFGKIVCISAGCFDVKDNITSLRIKSFYGDDESEILKEFSLLLAEKYSDSDKQLCAHNGKEFDYPYIVRRCLINGLPVPKILDNYGKKPWEVTLLDSMDMWKFGDYKSYTSLDLLAAVFGIPSPKDDINGEQVGEVYWNEKNIERIKTYCQKDVITVAQLLMKFKRLPSVEEKNIIITN